VIDNSHTRFALVTPGEWIAQAACKSVEDPSIFFPDRYHPREVKAAKAICATCPVQEDCRVFALANNERFGIWGMTSERQRVTMRRQMLNAGVQYRAAQVCARPDCNEVFFPFTGPQRYHSKECARQAKVEANAKYNERVRGYKSLKGRWSA